MYQLFFYPQYQFVLFLKAIPNPGQGDILLCFFLDALLLSVLLFTFAHTHSGVNIYYLTMKRLIPVQLSNSLQLYLHDFSLVMQITSGFRKKKKTPKLHISPLETRKKKKRKVKKELCVYCVKMKFKLSCKHNNRKDSRFVYIL